MFFFRKIRSNGNICIQKPDEEIACLTIILFYYRDENEKKRKKYYSFNIHFYFHNHLNIKIFFLILINDTTQFSNKISNLEFEQNQRLIPTFS